MLERKMTFTGFTYSGEDEVIQQKAVKVRLEEVGTSLDAVN